MANKTNGLDASEWARAPPPPSGPIWVRILKIIYDPEEKSILGRTPKRWGIAITFYLVFYAVLALLFAACMSGLYLSIDEHRPTYTLNSSLIGPNPGVAYRPRAPLNSSDGVVSYIRDNSSTTDGYISQLAEFLQPYENEPWFLSASEKGCIVNDSFGFPDAPCFYIKLNKLFDWKPKTFDDVASLPADMPPHLVEHIKGLPANKRKQIWISCAEEKGRNNSQIEYPWGQGLPTLFYPFTNEKGYLSPLVAVRVIPRLNTLVSIRCRAWAKNIVYNKSLKEPSGYTLFQLQVNEHSSVDE